MMNKRSLNISFDRCTSIKTSRFSNPCTRQWFEQQIDSERVKSLCNTYVEGVMNPDDEMKVEVANDAKLHLPVVCFHASFFDGFRSNDSAVDSGLVMLDVDDKEGIYNLNPRAILEDLEKHISDYPEVLLTHISPSQRGFHVVAKKVGAGLNSEEQMRLFKTLFPTIPLECYDPTTCDLARVSCLVPRSYFVHMNLDELFGGQFDPRYVAYLYPEEQETADETNAMAAAVSTPTPDFCGDLFDAGTTPTPAIQQETPAIQQETPAMPEAQPSAQADPVDIDELENIRNQEEIKRLKSTISKDGKYLGDIPYSDIVAELEKYPNLKGKPGMRNLPVLQMATCLAYICRDAAHIMSILPKWALDHKECAKEVANAVIYSQTHEMPVVLKKVLRDLSGETELEGDKPPAIPEDLHPLMKAILEPYPDEMKPGMAMIALPMLGVLAGDAIFQYRGVEEHHTGFLSVLIGEQTSGKSAMTRLKRDLLSKLIDEDKIRRAEQKEYDDKLKIAKDGEKPKDPHIGFRIMNPICTRSQFFNNIDNLKGKRAIIVAPEIDSLNQRNNWCNDSGTNERLAFDTEEAGQDTKTADATTALVPLAVNVAYSGTPLAVKRHFKNTEDGLVTRLSIGELPDSSTYEGVEQPRSKRNLKILERIQDVLMSEKGDTIYKIPKLLKQADDWCKKMMDLADLNGNSAIKTYCKRDAVIGFRLGAILFLYDGHRVTKSALHTAFWIAKIALYEHVKLFGSQMNKSIEDNSKLLNAKVKISACNTIFAQIGEIFTSKQLRTRFAEAELNIESARTYIKRWKEHNWIEQCDNKTFRKTPQGLAVVQSFS